MAERWEHNPAFVDWLKRMNYARSNNDKLHLCMPDGIYVYMWEAWQAGKRAKSPARRPVAPKPDAA